MGSKVVKREKLTTISMVAGNEKIYKKVIDGGQVKEWVGIGWIDIDEKPDKRKHWLVVED